jgi:hypothetical protein
MNPKIIHLNICDFIDRWKTPPEYDEAGSLSMLSDFARCIGAEFKVSMPPKSDESKGKGGSE